MKVEIVTNDVIVITLSEDEAREIAADEMFEADDTLAITTRLGQGLNDCIDDLDAADEDDEDDEDILDDEDDEGDALDGGEEDDEDE